MASLSPVRPCVFLYNDPMKLGERTSWLIFEVSELRLTLFVKFVKIGENLLFSILHRILWK